jgi:hypothetical protein
VGVRWKQQDLEKVQAKSAPKPRAPKFRHPERIRKGRVNWYLVKEIAEWPCTPSGGIRAGAKPGIYLDDIKGHL